MTDISSIKIGHWYDTGWDSTVKVLDKLLDCFVVISYSNNHHVFSLDTYPLELVDDEWREIDPADWGFTKNNPKYNPDDIDSEAYLPFDIEQLSEKDL